MIGGGMAAFSETDQNENEESRPADKKCAHEPMAELEDVVDLVAVLGRVRWLPEKLVDAREARSTIRQSTKFSLSCDDAKPFHFPVKPDAVDDERDCAGERRYCTGEINRRAFHEINPNAPASNTEREQRREDNEDD